MAAVLLSADTFLRITDYQNGLPWDFLPLRHLRLPSSLMDYFKGGTVIQQWLSTHSLSRISRLVETLPHLHDVIYAYALYTGHLIVIDKYLHTPFLLASQLWDIAAAGGHLDSIEYLHKHIPKTMRTSAMMWACRFGHIETVKLLNTIHAPHASDAFDSAAACGHLEIMKWMQTTKITGTTRAMDEAAKGGHFDVVLYLHETKLLSCSKFAMDYAAGNGHIRLVRWLNMNRNEGCTTYAMDAAASNGHLDVVEYLHNYRTEGCTKEAMNWAAWGGHLDVVKFLHGYRTEGCSTDAIDWASRQGHLNVVDFLTLNRSEGGTSQALRYAARFGHISIVKYLWNNRSQECLLEVALNEAHAANQVDVIKYLKMQSI